MPYKDPDQRRAAMRDWAKKRRATWLAGQVCASCGTKDDLHVFGAKKHGGGAFTSSTAVRDEKLRDVIVLCDGCAKKDRRARAAAAAERRNQRRRVPDAERRRAKPNKQPKPPKPEVVPEPQVAREVAPPKRQVGPPLDLSSAQSDLERRQRRREWREERRRELGYG